MSRSTPEAEIVAADATVKGHGLLCAVLWEAVMMPEPNVIMHDDNQSMIAVQGPGRILQCDTGKFTRS